MPSTLYLRPNGWDLAVDIAGNIAVAAQPYALAQDAASALRLFKGECYYDTTQGVPYWQQILGKFPPVELMKQQFVTAALTVPGVVRAQAFITSLTDRTVAGQVQVTDKVGAVSIAGF